MIDVPHKAYMEVRAEEVLLDGNASQDELIRAIHSLIERCHYANDNPSSEGLKGWTQFVQDHLLIVGSINRGSLRFEPWARKNSGHKNGHYVPDHEHAEFCAPSVDIEQAHQALCQARDAANEYDNNAVA